MAMSDEQLADYFRNLEQPVLDLGAMVEIVIWFGEKTTTAL